MLAGGRWGFLQAGTGSTSCLTTQPGEGDPHKSLHRLAPVSAQPQSSALGVQRATEALVPPAGGCCRMPEPPTSKGHEGALVGPRLLDLLCHPAAVAYSPGSPCRFCGSVFLFFFSTRPTTFFPYNPLLGSLARVNHLCYSPCWARPGARRAEGCPQRLRWSRAPRR